MDAKFPGALVILWAVILPVHAPCEALSGRVIAPDGRPVRDVLVITSGFGFGGWAKTDTDGAFQLRQTGEFVSFRHGDYQPQLIRTADLPVPLEVQLQPKDASVWQVPHCQSIARPAKRWIGRGLRIRQTGSYKGPVYGDHDAHWYVSRGKDTLHLADGHAWHAGLPGRQILTDSEHIGVRGWIYEDIAGLDITGRSKDGRYWRWVGAPLASSIEYETRNRAVAEEFDRLIGTMCFGEP